MDNNNWRPTQGGEPSIDTGDWWSQLQSDSRQRIVNKIMDTLKRHLPFSGQEGLQELKKTAVRFEEKIYTAATSQSDYLRKISLKMLTMETKNPIPNSLQSNSAGNGQNPPDPASLDSTGNANGGDWQEEIYQKIKAMKDMYLLELTEMYQKIAAKLHQHDSLLQQPQSQHGKNLQLNKLKAFNDLLERFITLLQVSKNNIQPIYKEKLGSYEKQIISILSSNRPRKPVSSPQGLLPPSHMHSIQQSQQPQSQMTQLQPLENQMNPQMQPMNLQSSGAAMQQKTMTSLQHNPSSPLSGISNSQQNMINTLQSSSTLDPGQNNSMNSLQQVAVGSLQQNPVSGPQQANMNLISSQSGMNTLQPNLNPLQPNSNMLQHQHLII